jgi:hypothetical protein
MDETERGLRKRAAFRGSEAFNLGRMRQADSLQHEEPCGAYVLRVKGGLGSFSVGTLAELLQDGKTVHRAYVVSWVYCGREAALTRAREWAREMVGDVG